MIETTALFFVFASVPYAIDLVNGTSAWRSAWFCGAFGTLAALQKITTAVPVLMVMGGVWLWACRRPGEVRRRGRRGLLQVMVAFVLPAMIAGAWAVYAGSLRVRNPIAAELEGALRGWNFGTLAQRFNLSDWTTLLWHRILAQNAGGFLGVALIAGPLTLPGPARVRSAILTGLALFLAPLFIFTNLHFVHAYYQAGCAIFLIGSLALATVAWLPAVVPQGAVVPAVTTLLVVSNIMEFRKSYGPMTRTRLDAANQVTLAVAAALRQHTSAGSGLVVFGQDWSSETPYYARRKAFAVPSWFSGQDRVWADPARFLGETPSGAIVVFPEARTPDPMQITQKLAGHPGWRLLEIQGCRILLAD